MSVNQGRVMDVHEIVNKLQKQATGQRNGEGPSGNIDIEQNGIYDVTDYAQATVQVPNTYAAGDEGKVVSNGALVSQTAHADVTPTTADQTIDTTLNNSIKVKGDADLIAGNIKKDVEIFGVTGSYEGGGGGITVNDIAEKSISGAITLSTATSIKERAFSDYTGITSIESESVTTIGGNYAMAGMTALQSVSLPNMANNIQSYTFSGCINLETVNLHKAIYTGGNAFQNCKKLVKLALPALIGGTNASFADGATLLEKCDLGNCTKVQSVAFRNTALNILVLRRTSLVTLDSTNAFTGTPFESGGAGGHIYIPKSLYDQLGTGTNDYKASTNRSTVDGYGTKTWHAIEGTSYETHYADDTVIPTP